MTTETKTRLEETFSSLPEEERDSIISLGVALKLSYLRKRLVVAQRKQEEFETRYGLTIEQLERQGLPDDADYAMHEDYILWHHWSDTLAKVRQEIATLEEVAAEGNYQESVLYARG
jgi:hypothetical protein